MNNQIQHLLVAPLVLLLIGCDSLCPGKPRWSAHPLSAGAMQTVTYDATKRAAFFLYVPDLKSDGNIRRALEHETGQLLKLQKRLNTLEADRNVSGSQCIEREIAETIRRINQLGVLAVRPAVLAENPPDAARSTSTLLSIAASYPTTGATGQLTATSVSQVFALAKLESQNYILRDALYRLNEGLLLRPDLLDDEEYLSIFTKILETVKTINQMEATQDPSHGTPKKDRR